MSIAETPKKLKHPLEKSVNIVSTLFLSFWLAFWSLGVGWISTMVAGSGPESYFSLIFLLTHGGAQIAVTRMLTSRIVSMLGTAPVSLSDEFDETSVTISRSPRAGILLVAMVIQIVFIGAILLGGSWRPTYLDPTAKSVIMGVLLTLLWVIAIGIPWKKALSTLWQGLHTVELNLSNDGVSLERTGPFVQKSQKYKPEDLAIEDGADGQVSLLVSDKERFDFSGEDAQRVRTLIASITEHNQENPIIQPAIPNAITKMRQADNQTT